MFTRDHIHHAYIIEGEKGAILVELLGLVEKELGIEVRGNPDFFQEEFDVFGIDDGRRLKEMQSNSAFSGARKVFVIITRSITNEAQNSLLKVFEEPTASTHLFIIIPSINKLLPTFKSRAQIIRHKSILTNESDIKVEDFVKSNIAKRLAMVKGIIESKDKEKAEKFLKSLAMFVRGKDVKKIDKKSEVALQEISKALLYIGDRSSSVKLLLENIALTL